MIPTQIKDLEHSLITKKARGKNIKALSSAVIYGPNSAGKTNIIGGIEVLRSIILNGNIKNKEDNTTANIAVSKLEIIPNIKNERDEPVEFYIKFFINGMIIELKLILNLESFLSNQNNRRIIEEELKINSKLIYDRSDSVKFGKFEEIKEYLIENFSETTAEKIAQSNLDSQELFLNSIFKTLYSKKIYEIIVQWFQKKLQIIYRADHLEITPIISRNNKQEKFFIDKNLNKALFRRDEIKFVEKEEETSIQYSLSDFGTNGNSGVRNTEDYMKNYFINKYGAIRSIDFSNVFTMNEGEERIDEKDK